MKCGVRGRQEGCHVSWALQPGRGKEGGPDGAERVQAPRP